MADEPMTAKERGALGAAKRWNKNGESQSEVPKYRITARCYHNDKIYDPELQPPIDQHDPDKGLRPLYLDFVGPPSYYMEPANQAAQDAWDANPPEPWCDPINTMTKIQPNKQAAIDALAALVAAG